MTETALAVSQIQDLSKLNSKQINFLKDYHNKELVVGTVNNMGKEASSMFQKIFEVVKDHEIALGILLYIIVLGLHRVGFLDAIETGIIKGGILLWIGFETLTPW